MVYAEKMEIERQVRPAESTIRRVARKKPKFDAGQVVRKLARERVGTVPSSRPIEPKRSRKKPKHKKPILTEEIE